MIYWDDTHWPLLETTVDALPNDDELETFLRDASQVLEQQRLYVWLIAMEHSQPIPPEHIARYAEWIRRSRLGLSTSCLGGCLVVPTMIGRLGVRAIFLLEPPPTPTTVLATRDAGRTWCLKRLLESGQRVPDALRDSAPELCAVKRL